MIGKGGREDTRPGKAALSSAYSRNELTRNVWVQPQPNSAMQTILIFVYFL
jgi:hypothetical protein